MTQPLPLYWVMGRLAVPILLAAYVIILFSLVVQTAVGMLQGIIERLDSWQCERTGNTFTPRTHALISGSLIILSLALSKIGIIDLVAQGYGTIAWCFTALFPVPLLTIGIYKIIKGGRPIENACECDAAALPAANADKNI